MDTRKAITEALSSDHLLMEGLFRDYHHYTKLFSEAPPEFHIFTLSHTISCIVERNRWIQQGEDTIYPNQYTVIVALSSLFKKTSTMTLCNKNLSRIGHLESKLLGHIGSPEGLFSGLKANKGIGFFNYSELGLLLAQANKQYMADVVEILNDLYDCPPYYSRRLSGKLHEVKDVFVNLLGATQLNSLTEHIKESTLLSGFLPRFTLVYSENLQPHIIRRPKPDEALQDKIIKQLKRIKEAMMEPRELDLTPEGWTAFESWANERYKRAKIAPPQIQPMYGRIEAHCFKYAIIIQQARDPNADIIDVDVVSKAAIWADFILNSYQRLVLDELAFTYREKMVKKVADIVKAKGNPPNWCTHRLVVQGTKYTEHELGVITGMLDKMGKIKRDTGPKGGRIYQWIDMTITETG
jgi:hypothetical protein